MQDLRWIAGVLGISVRLTVEAEVLPPMQQVFPWMCKDIVFGLGPLSAHLLFGWRKAAVEDRTFGHYDLLIPTTKKLFAMLLPNDVPAWSNYLWILTFFTFEHCKF